MKEVLGTVKVLEGKYFAKDSDGNVVELHVGDKITQDMTVFGAKTNSEAANIQIAMSNLDQVIELTGSQEQTFDASLVEDGNLDDPLANTSIKGALDTSIYANIGNTENADKVVDPTASDTTSAPDETAAGGNTAPVGQSQSDVFDVRDGAQVNVNSTLRDASFNSSGQAVNNQDGTDQANINQVNPISIAPVSIDSSIIAIEDTHYVFALNDFGFRDADVGDTLQSVRIDSLPHHGNLYLNGTAVTGATEVTATQIANGNLEFRPALNESGSNSYNNTGVGDQHNDYARFTYSVNDGTFFSANSATMTVDVTAVADAPSLNVSGNAVISQTIDVGNVHSTDLGYSIKAYHPRGGAADISSHGTAGSTSANGFGVLGHASGDTTELGYLRAPDGSLIGSEKLVISLDNAVSSTDIAFSWQNNTEHAIITFQLNGVDVGSQIDYVNPLATDQNDPAKTFVPTNGGVFDTIIMEAGTNVWRNYDDYLIHEITFNRVITGTGPIVMENNSSVKLDIASSLTDTDGSELLGLSIKDIPTGFTLTDGIHAFTSSATATAVDMNNWNLHNLSLSVPNVDSGVQYSLNVVATSTENSNGDTAQTTHALNITGGSSVTQDFTGDLTSDTTTAANQNDVINVGHDILTHTLNTGDGNDIVNVGHDIKDNVNTGTGNDTINVGNDIGGSAQINMGAGDDTLNINVDPTTNGSIDMGTGIDSLALHGNLNLDLSTANIANITNVEKIDLTQGDHTLNNLSLNDVLNMTDHNNTLQVTGDSADHVNVDNSGWIQSGTAVDNGTSTTYTYSSNTTSDSVTLTVDDQIITTGM